MRLFPVRAPFPLQIDYEGILIGMEKDNILENQGDNRHLVTDVKIDDLP